MTIYTLMSPKRQDKIRQVIAKWKSMVGRGFRNKTHCPRGHLYSGTNIKLIQGKYKSCRTCANDWNRARYRLRKEKSINEVI